MFIPLLSSIQLDVALEIPVLTSSNVTTSMPNVTECASVVLDSLSINQEFVVSMLDSLKHWARVSSFMKSAYKRLHL